MKAKLFRLGHGPRKAEVARRARITGRVQGVGYRHWTATKAEELDLRGYVRNLTDGSVEALFIGDAEQIALMLASCADGPQGAEVQGVEAAPPEPSDKLDLTGFRQAQTGDPGSPAR
ncbi:MAG: acylphosphatase [Pseudomonadota bacterium]